LWFCFFLGGFGFFIGGFGFFLGALTRSTNQFPILRVHPSHPSYPSHPSAHPTHPSPQTLQPHPRTKNWVSSETPKPGEGDGPLRRQHTGKTTNKC
jgi:hypothetical protein